MVGFLLPLPVVQVDQESFWASGFLVFLILIMTIPEDNRMIFTNVRLSGNLNHAEKGRHHYKAFFHNNKHHELARYDQILQLLFLELIVKLISFDVLQVRDSRRM